MSRSTFLRCGHCGHANTGRGTGSDLAGNRYPTKTCHAGERCPYCRFGVLVKGSAR
jgi:DNA-directed RNA polymerase subunit RPC12/RpoP